MDNLTEAILNDFELNSRNSPVFEILNKKPYAGTKISKVRQKLWDKNPDCFYCKKELSLSEATIDHYIPKSKGGTNFITNLRISCLKCNRRKADKLPDDVKLPVKLPNILPKMVMEEELFFADKKNKILDAILSLENLRKAKLDKKERYDDKIMFVLRNLANDLLKQVHELNAGRNIFLSNNKDIKK